jgi:hypothetical protein
MTGKPFSIFWLFHRLPFQIGSIRNLWGEAKSGLVLPHRSTANL